MAFGLLAPPVIAPILRKAILVSVITAAYILAVTVTDIAAVSYWMLFATFTTLTNIWFGIDKAIAFKAIVTIISGRIQRARRCDRCIYDHRYRDRPLGSRGARNLENYRIGSGVP